ncbi:MAG TPA: enolase C-terminal domain-like protein, partial [Opitutus sp.]|nr:enolase C-terminal domain-like protein [Opitutus sp.]
MSSSRRQFIKHLASGAVVTAAGSSFARAASSAKHTLSGNASRPKHYGYLGRTEDYQEWAVVPRGLTVKKIETFRREMLALVRVTASDGSVGWGQIAPYEANISAEVLHQLVARRVLGRDISDIDAINDEVIDANMKWPWSAVCRALCGVDTALWDLYGQLTGKPVAVLLGGSVRPLPAYGSSMRRDISATDEAERLARLRDEMGYKAFKIRLGTPTGHNRDASPGRSEAIIPAVRKAVGPDVDLFADANSCYTPDVA